MANNVYSVVSLVFFDRNDKRIDRAISVVKAVLSDVIREKTPQISNDPESWIVKNDDAVIDFATTGVEINATFITGWTPCKKEIKTLSSLFPDCPVFFDAECIETNLDVSYTYRNGKIISYC